jgi:hypothetical protein
MVSWSSKYSSVALVTIAGGAKPIAAVRDSRRSPSAGHSALSLAERLGSRSSGGICTVSQQHTATHGFDDVVEPGFVVADDPEFEFGDEVEEVAAHERG